MSTKNIEIDFQVFERLSSVTKERLEVLPSLSNADSQLILKVIAENRADERWAASDLR